MKRERASRLSHQVESSYVLCAAVGFSSTHHCLHKVLVVRTMSSRPVGFVRLLQRYVNTSMPPRKFRDDVAKVDYSS